VERGLKSRQRVEVTHDNARFVAGHERPPWENCARYGRQCIDCGWRSLQKANESLETWVDGRRFEIERPVVTDVRGSWQLELSGSDDRTLKLKLENHR